jgi:hypothetical protein
MTGCRPFPGRFIVVFLCQQPGTGDVCDLFSGRAYMKLQGFTILYECVSEAKVTTAAKHHVPWYLWPFAAVWKLIAVIFEMTGRLLAMILGIVLMLVGVLISLTVIGAIIGIPLAIVGFLLFIRGIF